MTKLIAALCAALIGFGVTAVAQAAPPDKVTICHAAGLAGTTKFVTLTLPYPAVYGNGGHFNENGTTQAGHEQDYLGPCTSGEPSEEPSEDPSTTPEPEPSEDPSTTPDPSETPTPEPSEDPSVTPVPEPTPVVDPTPTLPEPPLYGGCKEWRPEYGPKPAECKQHQQPTTQPKAEPVAVPTAVAAGL